MIRCTRHHPLRRVALAVIVPMTALTLVIGFGTPAFASPLATCQPSNQHHCLPTRQNLPKNLPNVQLPSPQPNNNNRNAGSPCAGQQQGGCRVTAAPDPMGDASLFLQTPIAGHPHDNNTDPNQPPNTDHCEHGRWIGQLQHQDQPCVVDAPSPAGAASPLLTTPITK